MENKPLVLIIEDEESICDFMSIVLTSNGYTVITASTGKEAISMAASYGPDLVLLDLGLPDMDGLRVLKTIRKWTSLPVVVVSARGQERKKVEALDLGADDYITKPFGTSELLARIRTALRHGFRAAGGASIDMSRFNLGDLSIDYEKRIVSLEGAEVHLTPIEYKIIVLLSRNIGRVLTYEAMIKDVWGPFTNDTFASEVQSLRVNMANIRRKLETNPAEPRYIVTEVGVGYRMVEE